MRWIRTAQWVSLCWAIFVGVLTAAPLPSLAQGPGTTPQKEEPVAEILSPKDKEQFEYGGTVEGRVTPGYWPFIAVAPLGAAPRIWIQPPIIAVRRNGTFNGLAWPGTPKAGCGQKYSLFIFAHQNKARFKEGEVLMEIPKDCVMSDPVTVLRPKPPGSGPGEACQ